MRVYECSASPSDGKGCATVAPSASLVAGKQPPEPTEILFTGPFTGEFDPAALGDTMTIFDDDQVFPWKWDSFIASGSLDFELVETDDPDHGTVIQTTFNTNEAVVYFQAPVHLRPQRLGGRFRRIRPSCGHLDLGGASGFMIKVDCVHPCSSGDFPIGEPPVGEWVHYVVPISRPPRPTRGQPWT